MMEATYTAMETIKKHVKAVIQLRRATEQEWIDYDPVLRVGEPALSIDKDKLKIGDGRRHWSEIPYILETEFALIEQIIEQGGTYGAGNGIIVEDRLISLDDLILDCGTSTTNI